MIRPKRKKARKKAPSLPSLKKKAWKLLSLLVRKTAGPEGTALCYTCGAEHKISELQAGHAIPGRTGTTLLDEEIIRVQCQVCNIWKRGQYHIFSTKLIQEKAAELAITGANLVPLSLAFDWWEKKLIQAHQVKKWNRPDLEAQIETYKARLASL